MPIPNAAPAFLFVLALSACSTADDHPGTTFQDSAGVPIATAETPRWEPGDGWRFSPDPWVQIGLVDGPDEYIFSDLVGAVRLSDGRIVVADRGSSDLRYFDSEGTFISASGGEGEGPGEFRSLDFIGLVPGDTVLTYDGRLVRIQLFDPAGAFVRSIRVDSPWTAFLPEMMMGVVDGSHALMEFGGFGTRIPNGVVRWPPELMATVNLRTGLADSLTVLPGPEAHVENTGEGGYRHGFVMFGKDYEYAAGGGQVAIIGTDTFSVRTLDTAGKLTRVIRRPMAPESVTEAKVDEFLDTLLALVFPEESGADPVDMTNFRNTWENNARASTVPLLRSVYLDSEGNTWLEPYFHMGASPRPYFVFDAEGTWLGEVPLPPGLKRDSHPRRAPSFQIGKDFILGVWLDEMEVQYVRMYGLEKG